KISVPSICPPDISRVISDLLKGKWATRPSNEQLSLAGNAPIKDNWDPGSGYDHDANLLRLRDYPKSEGEVLDTWKARALLWEDLNRDKGEERSSVSRIEPIPPQSL
ncbi:3781_t:CDS:2, partial [Acaulospora colombiana]